jgi:cystathionine gamma-synthase
MNFSNYKKSTTSVWGGESDLNVTGAVTSPIVNSVAFSYHDVDHWHEVSL